MTRKKKTILSVCLFILIFGGLLVTATFTDLQVSRILTKNVLPQGQYYTEHIFGAVFESIGTIPEYFVGALMVQIVFLYIRRFMKAGAGKTALECGALFVIFALYAMWYSELFDYILRHFDLPDGRPAYIWGVVVFLGLLTSLFGTMAADHFSDESLKKLLKFAFVSMGAILLAMAIVQILKTPFGRMRFRAMNTIDDFSGFTRWYIAGGQPDKEWMQATFGTTDAFKSFPSGHTRSAAATFYLATMADVLEIKDRKKKAALWLFAVLFTGTVAVSRIMVGAHFFSDVLVGGAIGFACAVLSKEIFICRCENIKSLFHK